MAKKSNELPTAYSGVPFEIANESNVVCFWDAGRREQLMDSRLGEIGAEIFTQDIEALAQLARDEVFQHVTVPRDCEVSGEILPRRLTSGEQAEQGWQEIPVGKLRLIKGKMRLETMPSFTFGDEPSEESVELSAKAGQYELFWYQPAERIVPTDLHGKIIDEPVVEPSPNLPRFLLGLVPLAAKSAATEVKVKKCKPPGEERVVELPPPPWECPRDYTRGCVFPVRLNTWDPHGRFNLNLTRQALRDLGLTAGDVLEVTLGSFRAALIYLGDRLTSSDIQNSLMIYTEMIKHDSITAAFAGWLDVAFLTSLPTAERPIHECFRIIREEKLRIGRDWRLGLARVLPERLAFLTAEQLANWTYDQGLLRGRVLAVSPKYLAINWNRESFTPMVVQRWERLTLKAGSLEQPLEIYANQDEVLRIHEFRHGGPLKRDFFKKHYGDDAIYLDHLQPDTPVLAGIPQTHWFQLDQEVLLVMRTRLDASNASKFMFA